MNLNPLVSVVIPTFNREKFIAESLASVKAQSYKNIEIIVVDDFSDDNTETLVNNLNIKNLIYIKHKKNLGAAAARNTGIKSSHGEFVAFLDSDDTWLPKKIEKQVKLIFSCKKNIAGVHCGLEQIDFETRNFISKRIIREDINSQIKYNFGAAPSTCTLLIRKDILEKLSGFDPKLPAHQETELIIRLSKKYKLILLDEFLVKVKRNHDQIMGNPDNYIKAKEIIYEKHIDFLSTDLLYNLCNIIANDSIIKKNYKKAHKYLRKALQHKPFKPKTILSLVLNIFLPNLNHSLYKIKYPN